MSPSLVALMKNRHCPHRTSIRLPPQYVGARSSCGCRKIANGCFQAKPKAKPLQDIKCFWRVIRAKAELSAVRIHDLRQTFASLLVSGGMTLPMIGRLLGHTQVQITLPFARRLDDPLRAGLEQVGDMLRVKPRGFASGSM